MMFVQSLGGISHRRDEETRVEDLALAVRAFEHLARATGDREMGRRSRPPTRLRDLVDPANQVAGPETMPAVAGSRRIGPGRIRRA